LTPRVVDSADKILVARLAPGIVRAAHNVRTHDTGTKRVQHPLVGELDLSFEAMGLVADPGLTMFVHTAEPGSRTEQALNLLASWSATPDEETANADHKEQPRYGHRA
jgi:MmyB-like transcription regulator ligand binding domain